MMDFDMLLGKLINDHINSDGIDEIIRSLDEAVTRLELRRDREVGAVASPDLDYAG